MRSVAPSDSTRSGEPDRLNEPIPSASARHTGEIGETALKKRVSGRRPVLESDKMGYTIVPYGREPSD